MKFATSVIDGTLRLGLIEADSFVLLPADLGDLVDVICQGEAGLAAVRAAEQTAQHLHLAELTLAAPINRFRRDILCTGWNYHAHFDEGIGRRGGNEVERPKAPTFFSRSPDTVIGPTAPIAYDARISQKWDYEAEIALVIGKTLKSASRAEAKSAVFGYCLANDISQRDLQQRHGGQWLKGKSIDGTLPLGPFVATADTVDLAQITLECHVNGTLRQSARAAQMAFGIDELLAELSWGMTLRAGDVVLTGTPAGIGHAMSPPVYLQENDLIVVRATGLGEMRNICRVTDQVGQSDLTPWLEAPAV